ncbi:hypothetical protein [Comamonas badia]|uniref:hypothetical protein n=1 Tax=Comamonas badia TaxID=265291 RepID=UPI0004257242|nr:hypothetical protein [Comamonas badia]
MLYQTLAALLITALLGSVLAAHVLRGKFAPWTLSPLHALLGTTSLALLIAMLIEGDTPPQVLYALVLLLAAALGGFFLVSFHLRNRLPPKIIVIIHASVALCGFLTLASLLLN